MDFGNARSETAANRLIPGETSDRANYILPTANVLHALRPGGVILSQPAAVAATALGGTPIIIAMVGVVRALIATTVIVGDIVTVADTAINARGAFVRPTAGQFVVGEGVTAGTLTAPILGMVLEIPLVAGTAVAPQLGTILLWGNPGNAVRFTSA